MQKIKDILELKKQFRIFVFDVGGTIFNGKDVIGNSLEVLEDLNRDATVVLLSNGTESSLKYEEDLEVFGFKKHRHYNEVHTSGQFFRDTYKPNGIVKLYSIGVPYEDDLFNTSMFTRVNTPEEADMIAIERLLRPSNGFMVGVYAVHHFREDINKCLKLKLPMICTNPDKYFGDANYERPIIRPGSIANVYENGGGTVMYFGKPYSNFFQYAFQPWLALGMDKEDIILVGDLLSADIKGGRDFGIKTCLTLSGLEDYWMAVKKQNITQACYCYDVYPDFVIDSL